MSWTLLDSWIRSYLLIFSGEVSPLVAPENYGKRVLSSIFSGGMLHTQRGLKSRNSILESGNNTKKEDLSPDPRPVLFARLDYPSEGNDPQAA